MKKYSQNCYPINSQRKESSENPSGETALSEEGVRKLSVREGARS